MRPPFPRLTDSVIPGQTPQVWALPLCFMLRPFSDLPSAPSPYQSARTPMGRSHILLKNVHSFPTEWSSGPALRILPQTSSPLLPQYPLGSPALRFPSLDGRFPLGAARPGTPACHIQATLGESLSLQALEFAGEPKDLGFSPRFP